MLKIVEIIKKNIEKENKIEEAVTPFWNSKYTINPIIKLPKNPIHRTISIVAPTAPSKIFTLFSNF